MKINTKIISVVTLFVILIAGFLVRSYSFWLPHWEGDQSQYVTLAMKMSHTPGLSKYNLYEVKLRKAGFNAKDSLRFMNPIYVEGIDGDLISAYKRYGMEYYCIPFFWKGPMLPMMIKWSHDLFLGKDKPFFVMRSNLGEAVYKFHPIGIFKSQFWLAIVPIFFNLAMAVILYLFCRCFTRSHAALMTT